MSGGYRSSWGFGLAEEPRATLRPVVCGASSRCNLCRAGCQAGSWGRVSLSPEKRGRRRSGGGSQCCRVEPARGVWGGSRRLSGASLRSSLAFVCPVFDLMGRKGLPTLKSICTVLWEPVETLCSRWQRCSDLVRLRVLWPRQRPFSRHSQQAWAPPPPPAGSSS